MDSKRINETEQESVQPPMKHAASGQGDAKKLVRTAERIERPLEERRVVRKAEEMAEPLDGKTGASLMKELDWPLSRRINRDGRKKMPEEGAPIEAAERKGRQLTEAEERIRSFGRVGQWFQTLCWMNIPVFGFFYMLVLAIRKKTPPQKKSFAIAYILYRILVLLLAVTILFVLYKIGLSFIDEILRYAGS